MTKTHRLTLRRESIRALTADELQSAHGGRKDGTGTGTNNTTGNITRYPPTKKTVVSTRI